MQNRKSQSTIMKEFFYQSRKSTLVILTLLSLGNLIHFEECSCQFHWSKQSKLEAAMVGETVSRKLMAKNPWYIARNALVRN